ncbi:MAG: putative transcription regulator with domain, partial [Candidatus Solibacter sp.]|nr:putative transcription regulator with domain [Candidatus Solibacter sp.]
ADGGFVITFPDFACGVSQGDTEAEARDMAAALLQTLLREHLRKGEPIPCPTRPRGNKFRPIRLAALAKFIETPDEFDRYVSMMNQLERRAEAGDRLSPEQEALVALLEQLVKNHDEQIELPDVPPHKMIAFLMEQRHLRQVDLLPVFGSRSVASDVLAGKREPSKAHIRKLAAFFHVFAELFL